jgi:hypothetical protein
MFTHHPLSGLELSAPSSDEIRSVGEIPSASGETKVELQWRAGEDDQPRLELVEYSWGSGLGWYPRKRLTLDCEQGAALAALLSAEFAPASVPAPPRRRPALEEDGNVVRLLFPAG